MKFRGLTSRGTGKKRVTKTIDLGSAWPHIKVQEIANKVRAHEAHVVKPNEGGYANYLDAREACGFGREGGMLESVWMGCALEARKDMVLQLRAGELPEGWGAW